MSEAFSAHNANDRSSAVRLSPLDGLRGLAACGVALVYHPRLLFTDSVLADIPAPIAWVQVWGWTLVDLFFLISGYVFAHVYLGDDGLRKSALADFAMARVARLYPLHLLMLCLCAFVFFGEPGNTPLAFVANLLMLQAFVQPVGHTFDGPTWSISIEVVCYVIFAMAAVRGRRVLGVVGGIAILVALIHFIVQGRSGGPWVGDGVPRGLLGFFLGQFLWQFRERLMALPMPALLAALVLGLYVDMGSMSSVPPLSLLAWPALLLIALRTAWMGSTPVRWLGDRSYAIYLLHFPLQLLATRWWPQFGGGAATYWAVTGVFSAIVLLLSDMCYRWFEAPCRDAIRVAWARRARIQALRSA